MNENTPLPQTVDDDSALDPAAMLALLQRQQSEFPRQRARQIPWILVAWAVVYLVGYGMLWLIDGLQPAFGIPLPIAVVTFIALMIAAIVLSAIIGTRAGRGIRSNPSAAFTGTVFGITCSAAFLSTYLFGVALIFNGMDPNLQPIFFSTAFGIIIGIIYLMSGAIWHAIPAIVMGAALLVVSLVAPFFGYPNNYLVFALGGGIVFLAGAISVAMWARGGTR